MPRERRAWEPGNILSIVDRAHEGRPIFATDEDRGFFVDRLRRVFVPSEVDLLARAVLEKRESSLRPAGQPTGWLSARLR